MLEETRLEAKMEPFDSFWEAPSNIEKGFGKFEKFYLRNYFKYLEIKKYERVLVVSCGPGYFLKTLENKGVANVVGIDSDDVKVAHATGKGLNALTAHAVAFLEENDEPFDTIFLEQEINHLTKREMLEFLPLCRKNLKPNGRLVVHSLNGANPITGAEALAQNFDHYNTLTEYSLGQVLEYSGYEVKQIFPLNLYIFYENPINYIGLAADWLLCALFRLLFIFYGKKNRLFSKKIAAIGIKKH